VVFGEEALGVRHHGHGAAERLGDVAERADGAVGGAQVRPGEQDRLLRAGQQGGRPVDRSGQGAGAAFFGGHDGLIRSRLGAGRIGQVAGDLDVGGLALAQRGADRVIDHRWRVVGVHDADRGAGHVLEHLVLVGEVVRAQAVMQEMAGASAVGVVPGRHEDHRKPFGVSPGHAIQRGERSDVDRGNDRAAAIDPGKGFRGVGSVELVTAQIGQFGAA